MAAPPIDRFDSERSVAPLFVVTDCEAAVRNRTPKHEDDCDVAGVTVDPGGDGGKPGKIRQGGGAGARCRRRGLARCCAPAVLACCSVLGLLAAIALLRDRGNEEVTLHVSGHGEVSDADAHALFKHLRDGDRNLTLHVVNEEAHFARGFSMQVEQFQPSVAAANGSSVRRVALLINEAEGGYALGNTTVTALTCESDGAAEWGCALEARRGRSLGGDIGDNMADVIKHGITYVTVGAVLIVCIAACSAAAIAAAPAVAASGCFPSRATVQALHGGVRAMKGLSIGTLLLTSRGYAPVFLHGHSDPHAVTSMVRLATASNHTLSVTPDHYLPLSAGTHRSAASLRVGDKLLVQGGRELVPSEVTTVQLVSERGLFNPYTTAGDLIVDGVLASSHSSWLLEGIAPEPWIVPVYEALLSPLGRLYTVTPGWFERFDAALTEKGTAPLDDAGFLRIAWVAAATLAGWPGAHARGPA